MFFRLGSIAVIAFFGFTSVACMTTAPDENESEAVAVMSQALSNSVQKITVCHIPPGNPGNAHTVSVGSPSLPAHLAHGDTVGECAPPGEDDGEASPASVPICIADGAACSADSNCCSGLCGGSGICTSQCTSVFDGSSQCGTSMDCCAGAACIQGLCFEGLTCKLQGTACNLDPEAGDWCCFGMVCTDNGAGFGTCQ